jgi:alpha-D-xyloside xylohydrolase
MIEDKKLKTTKLTVCCVFCAAALLAGAPWRAAAQTQLTTTVTQVAPGVFDLKAGVPETIVPSLVRQTAQTNALAAMPSVTTPPLTGITVWQLTNGGCRIVLPLGANEMIYGLGLQCKHVVQNGLSRTLYAWSGDDNGTGMSHAPVPFYVSTAGYGVLVDSARYMTFSVGAADPNPPATSAGPFVYVDVPSAQGVNVYLFGGPQMGNAIARYNLYSGGGCLPALDGLGPHYIFGTMLNSSSVLAMCDQIQQEQVPVTTAALEPGWEAGSYPSDYLWNTGNYPADFGATMRQRGYDLYLWCQLYIDPSSPLISLLGTRVGNTQMWNGQIPDLADPVARQIYGNFLTDNFINQGIAGFKLDEVDIMDFATNTSFPSGASGDQMHNLLGRLGVQASYDAFHGDNRRTFSMVRANQAWAAPLPDVVYSDEYDFGDYMRYNLSAGVQGVLWTPEVRDATDERDWALRVGAAAFSARMVYNAWQFPNLSWKQPNLSSNSDNQLLPDSSNPNLTLTHYFNNLRMALIPYLYQAYSDYQSKGIAPVRPLVADWPGDTNTWFLDDEWMLGSNILVAPVTDENDPSDSWTRTVYLPAGVWHNFWTGAALTGGQSQVVTATEQQPPVFVRDNTLLPLAQPFITIDGSTVFNIRLAGYGSNPGTCQLREDDGSTFNCEQGQWATLTVNANGTVSRPMNGQPQRYRIIGGAQTPSVLLNDLLAGATTSSSNSPGIISFNVCSPQNSSQDYLTGGDYAGAPGVRTNNWNNLVAGGNWSGANITMSSGSVSNSAGSIVSGLSATFHPAGNGGGVGTYSGGGNTNDTKMFVDYNDAFNCSGFSQYGYLDLTGIPFTSYQIYCYAATDNSGGGTGNVRGGFFVVTNAPGGAARCYIKDQDNNGNIIPEPNSSGSGYVQSTTTSIPSGGTSFANINGGNFAVFSASLTNSSARVWFGALGNGSGQDDLGNTLNDGDTTARLKVSGFQIVQVVSVPATNLYLSSASLTLHAGNPAGTQLIVLADLNNGTVGVDVTTAAGITYSVTDTNVATVSATGMLTPGTNGAASLIVTYQGLSVTNPITVIGPVSLLLQVANTNLFVSQSGQGDTTTATLYARFSDLNYYVPVGGYQYVSFSRSGGVALTSGGTITAVSPGVFSIIGNYDGLSVTNTGTVTTYSPPGASPAISVNIANGGTPGMAFDDLSGAPGARSAYWNNLVIASQGNVTNVLVPIDYHGAVQSGTLVEWVPNNPQLGLAATYGTPVVDESVLFSTVFDQGMNNGQSYSSQIVVSNVPYGLYDAYFYFQNDNSGEGVNRPGRVTIDGVTQYRINNTAYSAMPDNSGNGYVQAAPQTSGVPASYTNVPFGNYIKFSGLSDRVLNVSWGAVGVDVIPDAANGATRARLAGFQIVKSQSGSTNAQMLFFDSFEPPVCANVGTGYTGAAGNIDWTVSGFGNAFLAYGPEEQFSNQPGITGTNSQVIGGELNPGSFTKDLGIPFQPNTTYTVDVGGGNRAGFTISPMSFGLKSSAPGIILGATQGMIQEESLAAGRFVYASTLSNGLGNVFTFTTGPVVPPGDVVCYISTTGSGRIYADSFTVKTNAGTPSALAATVSPTNVAALAGDTVTFTVVPSGGNGFYTCQWYQTGAGRLAGQTNATLVLNGVTASLSGTSYYAAINDGSTTVDSAPATLTVTPRTQFLADQPWPDNNGTDIDAHGGGILNYQGVYYWFGESYANPAITGPQATGFHCYSSTDLYNWTDQGVVLARTNEPATNPTNDLNSSSIMERPKVIYNATTKKFVMWFHLDNQSYSLARSGVAEADQPTGPYTYLGSVNPDGGQDARDQTLFQDDDGKAYHIYASEGNATLHVSLLSTDYLSSAGQWVQALAGLYREAPAVFKYNGQYWLITSGQSSWDPNTAGYAVASSMLGAWTEVTNPCTDGSLPNVVRPTVAQWKSLGYPSVGEGGTNNPGSQWTFGGQSTFVLPFPGHTGAFIAMFDVWRPGSLFTSGYVWLPIIFGNNGFTIPWRDPWDLSFFGASSQSGFIPYVEDWGTTNGGSRVTALTNVGWTQVLGTDFSSGFYQAGGAMDDMTGAGLPTNSMWFGDNNAGPTLAMFYTTNGAGSGTYGDSAFTSIDPTLFPNLDFSVYAQWGWHGGALQRWFAVQAGGAWYVSTNHPIIPSQTGGTNYHRTDMIYNPAATNWNNLTVNSSVAIGGPAAAALSGPITGIGVVAKSTDGWWNINELQIASVASLGPISGGAIKGNSPTGGNSLTLNWTANANVHLQSATNLAPPIVWTDMTNTTGQGSATITTTNTKMFFRLIQQ